MEWVRAARRIGPQLAIGLLSWLGERLVKVIEDRDPSVADADVSWASADPVPRWLDHARELTERWIHRQQLLEALGLPPDLDPVLLVPVLDALRWAFPLRLGQVVRPAGSTVAIDVYGDGGGFGWILESDGSGWSFVPPEHPNGDHLAVMSASAEQARRRLSNNAPGIAGSPVVNGDPELVAVLDATRAIIGNPI